MLERVLYHKVIPSPIGPLRLIASEKGLCAVLFGGGQAYEVSFSGELEEKKDHFLLSRAEKQLGEYFAGKRVAFDLPLDMRGTVFQIKSWRELQKIPFGETISYAEQAKRLGDAKKARAVGAANGRNPLAIIVPCHRVIGTSGALTGFAGGLSIKEALLALEKKKAA